MADIESRIIEAKIAVMDAQEAAAQLRGPMGDGNELSMNRFLQTAFTSLECARIYAANLKSLGVAS